MIGVGVFHQFTHKELLALFIITLFVCAQHFDESPDHNTPTSTFIFFTPSKASIDFINLTYFPKSPNHQNSIQSKPTPKPPIKANHKATQIMKSILNLALAAIIYLICSVTAHQQNSSPRFLDLNSKYDALVSKIENEHVSHSAAPYSKALVEQMALKEQNGDEIERLGCLYEDEASWMCVHLLLEEKILQMRILSEELLWGLSKSEIEAGKDVEGWEVLEEVEMEDAGL